MYSVWERPHGRTYFYFGRLVSCARQARMSYRSSLYLHIWAPANATSDSSLPVRAWLFGGSNTQGGISNPTYDACNVPNTGAIMVSINYRLGPLGWLAIKNNSDIAGNMATQDQLLGLKWIQDNIAAFGGDPKKVVLHGQSAGAADAFVLATLPQAPELMSAVIMESGGGRDSTLNSTAYLARVLSKH